VFKSLKEKFNKKSLSTPLTNERLVAMIR